MSDPHDAASDAELHAWTQRLIRHLRHRGPAAQALVESLHKPAETTLMCLQHARRRYEAFLAHGYDEEGAMSAAASLLILNDPGGSERPSTESLKIRVPSYLAALALQARIEEAAARRNADAGTAPDEDTTRPSPQDNLPSSAD